MFKVSPASLQTFIDMPNCVLKDHAQHSTVHIPNVFCIGHFLIINCVGSVRIHRVFHCTKKEREKRSRRRKIHKSWRPNSFRNNSVRKHAVQECHRCMRCMSHSAILLKVGLVNFIFFQLCNEEIYNIVTVPLGVQSLQEKMGPTMRLCDIPIQTPIFPSCCGVSWNTWGLYAHQTRVF